MFILFFSTKPKASACESERHKLNIIPPQNPCTTKPLTSSLAKSTIKALMTSKKRPKVTKVIGIEMKVRIGRTTALRKDSTKATRIAEK